MDEDRHRDDRELAGVILWLLATGQEAHVGLDGSVRLQRSKMAERRERRRRRDEAMAAAEAKRKRKAEKLCRPK